MPSQPTPATSFSQLFSDNHWFWWGFGIFWIACLVFTIAIPLGDEIFWMNERRSSFGDFLFANGTKLAEAPGILLGILLLLFCPARYLVSVFPLGFCVALTSGLLKKWFAHPRPSSYFKDAGLFELLEPISGVTLNGGNSSFPSGHTMAGFAFFSFIAFAWSRSQKWTGLVFLALAIIVGLSRIYLIQHFTRDVLLGSILGVGLAVLWYFLAQRVWGQERPWLDQVILPRQK